MAVVRGRRPSRAGPVHWHSAGVSARLRRSYGRLRSAMPVYEYVCKSCGHQLEVSQSFKDAPLTTCPVCGGELRKVFSSVGIMFKGSGFYRTDSRGSGRTDSTPAKAGADKGESSGDKDKSDKSDKGGGEKSEKPAAASETKQAPSDSKPADKTDV